MGEWKLDSMESKIRCIYIYIGAFIGKREFVVELNMHEYAVGQFGMHAYHFNCPFC